GPIKKPSTSSTLSIAKLTKSYQEIRKRRSTMLGAQKINEKNLETVSSLEDDTWNYNDLSEFDIENGDTPGSRYQDNRTKLDAVDSRQNPEDFSLDGQGSDVSDGQELKQELQQFEASVAKNPNLSAEEKKNYQTKVEKWIHNIDLTP